MKIKEVLTAEEIRYMVQTSDGQGFLQVLTTWGLIFGSFWLVAEHPSVWTVLVAIIILGGRHLALAIIMHDASHYSLFETRKLNDIVGSWLGAYPTWQDLSRYRAHHWNHHSLAGTEKDPDLDLVTPFPVTRNSMLRKLLRDISGVSGFKRVYGNILMDSGKIEYTVSSKMVPIDQKGKTRRDVAETFLYNFQGPLLTNIALFLILHTWGHPWLYALWIVSYLTTFSLFVRIRSIAEHACTEMNPDPVRCTRTIYANPLARVTVAPHHVNYHLEHHLLMNVPSFRLAKLHRMLKKRGALAGAYVAKGYWEVMKTASSAVGETAE